MNFIELIIYIACVGFVVWLLVVPVKIAEPFRTIIIALSTFFVCLLILQYFGLFHGLSFTRTPRWPWGRQ